MLISYVTVILYIMYFDVPVMIIYLISISIATVSKTQAVCAA